MSRTSLTKTSFTAGELDPLLLGRLDLKAQEEGAAKLRNVVVHPTGGVSRRPGLRYLASLPGAVRLLAFDGADGGELLAFTDFHLAIIKDEAVVATLETLWSAEQTKALASARWNDRLFLCHPEVPPQVLLRQAGQPWQLTGWSFELDLSATDYQRPLQPYAKIARPECFIKINNGTDQAIAAETLVQVWASEPVFTAEHIDVVLQVTKDNVTSDLRIVNVDPIDHQVAYAVVKQRLANGKPTRQWTEQAFSEARGWPTTVAVYQERLVVGGTRDLPSRLWFSRTGHPLDFDPGEGLADESFAFELVGDEHHAIRSLVAGRQLQVLTIAGEWVVHGDPVGPGTASIQLQTRIGSQATPRIDPLDVDGATLFVGASGKELREFLYADSEQAYQAADIALLSRHLMAAPIGLAFERRRRWLLIPRGDGCMAQVTIDRNSNVVAWSLLESSGAVLSVCCHRGETYGLLALGGQTLLERFDDQLATDHAVARTQATPTTVWGGLDHLEGQEVLAITQEGDVARATVGAGTIVLPRPTVGILVGAAFTHLVEPVPLTVPTGPGTSLDRAYRPIRVVFRLLATGMLRANTGSGKQLVPLGPPGTSGSTGSTGPVFTGDVAMRALGWRRGASQPPWRIEQDDPAPCTILSVTTEIKGDV